MTLKRLKPFLQIAIIVSLVVMVASFVVSSILTQGAVLAQRIEPSAAASLFSDPTTPGTPIGSAQLMVIRDEAAFLEGTGEGGARFVSEKYLRENSIYPLQVKTVEFFRNIVAALAGLVALVSSVLWWRSR